MRVTQDVDLAALLSSRGDFLSAAVRAKLYEYLSDVLGIEHPETVSWINEGELEQAKQTLFGGKLKELRRLLPGGGEALAVFGADGTRPGRFPRRGDHHL